ncbi:dTDP-4-dehydrorhamnose reductase [Agrococcus sp. ARC_14]|uniref:dTDP-4-dehydrorhamnose reductase n=1 Tax=Agrococcus sp. ARC_14 TaxID=2919927 RepID=UPI001F05C681|nr:dTDP-4-dehydrorhamnose reductase [Agrococcus sp. ARC_14]MCH1882324.1 dTDP-4-dehydrorhamnose reductase [Agrococcus sp. ARC_14]
MRILVTGGTGMLGVDVVDALAGHDVRAVGSAELDIRDAEACMRAATDHGGAPVDAIVNCAAYTRVDDAESDEGAAFALNALGPANLAAAARAVGAVLLQVSTDYVFDGDASAPYAEDAPVAPVSAYGRTKAEGERLAREANPDTIVVRTAWLYGAGGPSFPRTMLRLAGERETLTVVDDQRGQPTWTRDLAAQLRALLEADVRSGVFHGTNEGQATWFDFARAVFAEAGLDPERVRPTDSAGFVRPAPRPAWSVLGHDGWAAADMTPMRDWREALHDAFARGEVTAA